MSKQRKRTREVPLVSRRIARLRIFREQNGVCQLCEAKLHDWVGTAEQRRRNLIMEMHHKVPVKCGGSSLRPNLIGVCTDCHKHADRIYERFGKIAVKRVKV